MSIKSTSLLPAVLLISSACAAQSISASEIVLNNESREISGWFSAKGEWTLFPDNPKDYDPYLSNENMRCVSILNATGQQRSEFNRYSGKRVVIRGYSVAYDNLMDGDNPADKLLSKKYFGGDVVENFCLRQYVFAATNLHEQ